MSYAKKARRAAGMTLEAASKIAGVSVPTLVEWEDNPEKYRLGAFIAIMSEMDDASREMMMRELAAHSEG
ncbi:MAG: helix-turn-helix domain-containing protein [Planifilum sp.]|jgi:hypothetical protein